MEQTKINNFTFLLKYFSKMRKNLKVENDDILPNFLTFSSTAILYILYYILYSSMMMGVGRYLYFLILIIFVMFTVLPSLKQLLI